MIRYPHLLPFGPSVLPLLEETRSRTIMAITRMARVLVILNIRIGPTACRRLDTQIRISVYVFKHSYHSDETEQLGMALSFSFNMSFVK